MVIIIDIYLNPTPTASAPAPRPTAHFRSVATSVNSASANTVRQWTFVFAGILNIAISCLNILSPA